MAWFFHQVLMPIVVIGVLVFIHELGHFLVAKWCGVGVVRFSVGFGPSIFRFRRKETTYQLSVIPLGGYVRMVGDMPDMLTGAQVTDEAVRDQDGEPADLDAAELTPETLAVLSDRKRWFIEKNFWQRSAIVFAGPLFNFLFAIALIFVVALVFGGDRMEEASIIGKVSPGSPAETAGLTEGDRVTAIDGKPIERWEQLAQAIHEGTGQPIEMALERSGQALTVVVHPQRKELRLITGEKKAVYLVGITPLLLHQEVGPGEALALGFSWTLDNSLLTYQGLWGMLTGNVSPKDLAGPLFILDAAGEQSEEGIDRLLRFTALLSVSLAVLNLLPIPILDGGHLMFFIIEALFGPISIRKKEYAQGVGMLLLVSLMVFALTNDITRDPKSLGGETQWDTNEADTGAGAAVHESEIKEKTAD
ncbi:MAG: RIP metalloprotease RseP [Bdellovibrionales bacterium]|nr:RIP metalloprotease RseP [Bdellovibrionales bacterium]